MPARPDAVAALPAAPGVYRFRDDRGRVLYVGKAIDLRRRVRSYFTGDERRKVGQLLREVARIDHIETAGELEAAVLEVRLIHELAPRFNRQAKLWRRYAYHGYLALQAVDRTLLEPRLPPGIFYNLLISAS